MPETGYLAVFLIGLAVAPQVLPEFHVTLLNYVGLSALVTAELPTVAIRVPAHPVARALIAAFGGPLAAPSANPSGRVSPTRADHVVDGLQGRIAAIRSWAYIAQRWGDEVIGEIMNAAPSLGIDRAFRRYTGVDLEELLRHRLPVSEALVTTYDDARRLVGTR